MLRGRPRHRKHPVYRRCRHVWPLCASKQKERNGQRKSPTVLACPWQQQQHCRGCGGVRAEDCTCAEGCGAPAAWQLREHIPWCLECHRFQTNCVMPNNCIDLLPIAAIHARSIAAESHECGQQPGCGELIEPVLRDQKRDDARDRESRGVRGKVL